MTRSVTTAALLLCLLIPAAISAQTMVYGVRVVVASEAQAAGPNKWFGRVEYFQGDSGYHAEACSAYVNPYGTLIPNGPLEFPGDWFQTGTFGNWCWTAQPGDCRKVDAELLPRPSKFGNFYRVVAMGPC